MTTLKSVVSNAIYRHHVLSAKYGLNEDDVRPRWPLRYVASPQFECNTAIRWLIMWCDNHISTLYGCLSTENDTTTAVTVLLQRDVITARDAMRKCGLCCRSVSARQYVCPSVTLVHCIQTAEDNVKLLCRPGSPIILVFLLPAPVPNSKGNPFNGGAKYRGGWKNFAIFDWNRRLSWKRYEIGP